MTSGISLPELVKRERKRPRKSVSNSTITRKSFRDQSTKILSIPLYIDYYNHYMKGIDQANQFRVVFIIHFQRNLKEFLLGVFWCLDLIVTNSYKLYLVINDSKITQIGNRDTNQHRNYVKDLVNLLFYMDSEGFALIITKKLYLKYQFQPHQVERKTSSNVINRVKNSINQQMNTLRTSEFLHEHYTHLKTSNKEYCTFCSKKERKPSKKRDLGLEDFSNSEFRFSSN